MIAAGSSTGTIVAQSPTASPIPPVSVVITGPPPESMFSTSAMPKVSVNSGVGLLGSAYAAQPAIRCCFSASSTSSRNITRSATGEAAAIACSRSASGPRPAMTSGMREDAALAA